MTYYGGSKKYIIDSLFLFEGESEAQQLEIMKDNLPIVERIVKDEFTKDFGFKLIQTIFKLIEESSNEKLKVSIIRLVLPYVFNKLKYFGKELQQNNKSFMQPISLFELLAEEFSKVLLAAYILYYFPDIKEEFSDKLQDSSLNQCELLLQKIFLSTVVNDKVYLSFCEYIFEFYGTNIRYCQFVVKHLALLENYENSILLMMNGNYDFVDFIIKSNVNVDDLQILMNSQQNYFHQNKFKPIAVSTSNFKNDYFQEARPYLLALSKEFPINEEENSLDSIKELCRFDCFRLLTYQVSYQQLQYCKRDDGISYIIVFVSKQLLFVHNSALCFEILEVLKRLWQTVSCDKVLPPGNSSLIRSLHCITQLQEYINGPPFVTLEIDKLMHELLNSLNLEEK